MPIYARRLRRLTASCLALVAGCELATAPQFPSTAVPFVAHAQYQFWWTLAEQCSGLSGSFNSIRWLEIPGVDAYVYAPGDTAVGSWWASGNRIVLAGNALDDGAVVRHEMLHALLRTGMHPPEYFQDRCAGFVACVNSCLDARPPSPIPDGAAAIEPKALTVQAQVIPPIYHNGDNGGWIAVAVSARNDSSYPVWVNLQNVNGFAQTFGATLRGGIGTIHLLRAVRMGFNADERKAAVIDIHIGEGSTLPAGDYGINAFFNSDSVPSLLVTVAQ